MTTLPPSRVTAGQAFYPRAWGAAENLKKAGSVPPMQKNLVENEVFRETGAGNEVRTRDLNLGKVALYQLSYSRLRVAYCRDAQGAKQVPALRV